MKSIWYETEKIRDTLARLGYDATLTTYDQAAPTRHYDVAIWFSPLLPMYLSRIGQYINKKTCYIAVSYYVIEGLIHNYLAYVQTMKWQYVVAPSNFVARNLRDMRINVKEVIPHQAPENLSVNHDYGRKWRQRFPTDKKILLYNGSQIIRKALPKLRDAVRLLSAKRHDFIMVYHTDNVRFQYHTNIEELYGDNVVVETDFPHIPIDQVYGKMAYADVIVHPAWAEGFGIPVLETLQLGKPLVCINANGVNEIANPDNSFMVMDTHEKTESWERWIDFRVSDYKTEDLAYQIELALDAPKDVLAAKQEAGFKTVDKFRHTYDAFGRFSP